MSMDFDKFLACSKALSPKISICVRGDHGIGKSQGVYQLGEHFAEKIGVPVEGYVVERRLSQMTEGDMIGLPDKHSIAEKCVTRFAPPDWYMACCDAPKLLFLDELNRASPEVMQAAFQIVLDRELNGHKLHKDTLVYIAVNTDVNYNVNNMDPALLDRFFMIDLKPTVGDWLKWADTHVAGSIVEFIRQNETFLEHIGNMEPGHVYPSRRSWHRLSDELVRMGIDTKSEEELFYPLCVGFVGTEAAISFKTFVGNKYRRISAEDVLDNWKKEEKHIRELNNEQLNDLISKVGLHWRKNEWTDSQYENSSKFMNRLPHELRIAMWAAIASDDKSGKARTDDDLKKIKTTFEAWKTAIIEAANSVVKFEEEKAKQEKEASEEAEKKPAAKKGKK